MEGAFLGLFPGPVVECNVEPAVLRDVYASYVSIPGPWYRGARGPSPGVYRVVGGAHGTLVLTVRTRSRM